MFKPHIGDCSNTGCNRTNVPIVVRDGYCDKCNHNRKQATKKASGRSVAKKTFAPTASGEGAMMREIGLSLLNDEYTRCSVCQSPIAALTYSNFAHILPKGKYPDFRLNPDNITILCHNLVNNNESTGNCHYKWDFRPRSEIQDDPMWAKMFEKEALLKEQYKNLEP